MSGQQSAPSLAYSKANNAEMSNNGKVALVAEGGGQRGIFTAGVLDTWLDAGHDPFDILIGTSAGSQNLTSFVARQKGYAKRLIRGFFVGYPVQVRWAQPTILLRGIKNNLFYIS